MAALCRSRQWNKGRLGVGRGVERPLTSATAERLFLAGSVSSYLSQ